MKTNLLFALAFSVLLVSCGGENNSHEGHAMDHSSGDSAAAKSTPVKINSASTDVIENYLAVKDALVNDDYAAASAKSTDLVAAFRQLDTAESNSEEVKKLLADAVASAEKLATEDPAAQRENFQALSVTLKELLKVIGTDRTLYQQHCPMYKNNTGGIWLSASDEIKNPLFGSKMLTCGRVEETLTSL